jgi:hypothetical protein
VPPRRAKRPVSASEYTPEELAEVEDFERRYPEEISFSPSSTSEDEEITSAPPSTASSPARDAIPRLTPEKRRTIQLQKARQGLGAQAAELKAIRKATNRVGSRRCRFCQLTCNSAAAFVEVGTEADGIHLFRCLQLMSVTFNRCHICQT